MVTRLKDAVEAKDSSWSRFMAISNSVTRLLGIKHPIVLAPMDLVAHARLALAVSQAGGFGFLGAGYGDAAWLERELANLSQSNAQLHQPFGVGFITWSLLRQPHLLDLALAANPRAVLLSFGDPEPFVRRIKDAGALLVCQVQHVGMAIDVVAKGADIVVAQGGEAGGHGVSQGSFTLVPAVVDAIGDEVPKQRIVAASGDQTLRSIVFDISRNNVWPHPFTGRCLANRHTQRWLGRELELMRREDVIAKFAGACQTGNFDIAPVIAGEAVALVRNIRSANEIVWRTVAEAERLLAGGSHWVTKENSAAA